MTMEGRNWLKLLAPVWCLILGCSQANHSWKLGASQPPDSAHAQPELFGSAGQSEPSDDQQRVSATVKDYLDSAPPVERPVHQEPSAPSAARSDVTAGMLPGPEAGRTTISPSQDTMGAISISDQDPAGSLGPASSGQRTLPVVEGVSVRPVRALASPQMPQQQAANSALVAAHALPESSITKEIELLTKAVAAQPNDFRSQLRLRYLYLAQEQYDKALSLPEGMDPQRAELLIKTIESSVAGARAVQSAELVSEDTVVAVSDLNQFVRAHAGLSIPRIELCTEVRSYGNFTPIPQHYFTAYQQREVVVYCEVENFAAEQSAGEFVVRLSYRMMLYTPEGHLIWEEPAAQQLTDRCANYRTDFFFGRRWWLPAGIAPGEYVLKVLVEDDIRNHTTEASRLIHVEPSGIVQQ